MSEHHGCRNCAIRQQSVLCRLTDDEADNYDLSRKLIFFGKGQVIFDMGTLPKGLYCINKGKVKLTQIGVDGREQIVHLARSGDIMGYRAILGGDRYSCSAVAIEDSELCCIPRQVFLDSVKKNPELAFQLILLFSNELKDAEKKITTIAQRPVKERLAQSLLMLKESYGVEKDGFTINVSITREEIANITGTTRETAIRTLFELSNEKVIELNAKKIRILDHARLVRIANLND